MRKPIHYQSIHKTGFPAFMKKMDSIENVAMIGALLKLKIWKI
jgi:transposase-like protein